MRALLVLLVLLADAVSLRLALRVAGVLPLLLWLLLAMSAGVVFIRRQGLNTVSALRAAAAVQQWPGVALWNGLLALIAGLLLIAPGFASDLLALPLLLPRPRQWLAQRLAAQRPGPVVIEGEFRERPQPSLPEPPPPPRKQL